MNYADQTPAEQPRWVPGARLKAALCGHLGQIEEGRKWINRLLALDPGLTIARFKRSAFGDSTAGFAFNKYGSRPPFLSTERSAFMLILRTYEFLKISLASDTAFKFGR